MEINGIILVNKEKGLSSNKVVNKVKYLLHANKAGHLGTLDVLGEGLLPVTLGKGTKLFDLFLNKDKEYITTFKFGETTITLDSEGEIINKNNVSISSKDILNIIPNFIGKINQIPPIYSAKKIAGKKAYQLARNSQITESDLKPKEIEIYDIKLLNCVENNIFQFKVKCSSGTYIRSLCRDMATALNTYGVMLDIIRTKCGGFSLKDAFTLNDIENGNYAILSLASLFSYQSIFLKEEGAKLLNGQIIKINLNDGLYKGYYNENFIGIIEIKNHNAKIAIRLI